jgi:hypothetical protein
MRIRLPQAEGGIADGNKTIQPLTAIVFQSISNGFQKCPDNRFSISVTVNPSRPTAILHCGNKSSYPDIDPSRDFVGQTHKTLLSIIHADEAMLGEITLLVIHVG